MSMLPEDPEGYLRRFKKRDGEEPEAPATAPTEPARPQRGAGPGRSQIAQDEQPGYDRADRAAMQQLLNAATPKAR